MHRCAQFLAALSSMAVGTRTTLVSFLLLSSAHWGDLRPVSSIIPVHSLLFQEKGFSVMTIIQDFLAQHY